MGYMHRPPLVLVVLALAGCTFDRSGVSQQDMASTGDHSWRDALAARDVQDQDAPSRDAPRLDALPADGGGWIEVYDLSAGLPGCPTTTPKNLVLEPAVQGCKIEGPLGCEQSGGNFAGWKVDPKVPYRYVAGFASGRQWKSTDAFSVQEQSPTIDDAYVEGVSITYGSPRQHIWTYVSGLNRTGGNTCPCWGGKRPPTFVGESYTCDSGNYTSTYQSVWYQAPLWDGDSAGVVGPSGDLGPGGCQPPTNPGWFQVKLPQETSDPIEVRILFDSCDENVALTELKLWVHGDATPSDLGVFDFGARPSDLTGQ